MPLDIIVIGMGRIGVGAYDWFSGQVGDMILGLDFDRETVDRHEKKGRNIKYADVTDPDFWRRLPAPEGTVKLVVLALNNIDSMLCVIKMLRQFGYQGNVAAVARFDDELEMLREAGVDLALNVFAEAGEGLAVHAVDTLGTFKTKSQ